LSQRGDDTQMAVGSDLMTNALEGYAVLKVARCIYEREAP
jgi:hypothetical protein